MCNSLHHVTQIKSRGDPGSTCLWSRLTNKESDLCNHVLQNIPRRRSRQRVSRGQWGSVSHLAPPISSTAPILSPSLSSPARNTGLPFKRWTPHSSAQKSMTNNPGCPRCRLQATQCWVVGMISLLSYCER